MHHEHVSHLKGFSKVGVLYDEHRNKWTAEKSLFVYHKINMIMYVNNDVRLGITTGAYRANISAITLSVN